MAAASWNDEEALRWMKSAGGRLHRRPGLPGQWAVVLEAPSPRGGAGRLVLAFGSSVAEAVSAARVGWDSIWREAPAG